MSKTASPELRPPSSMSDLQVKWLGRIGFLEALAQQEEIVNLKRADRSHPDMLLLVEHDPVYTIGRTPDQSSLRGISHLPHPLFPINRGGQATYHGPGQLVGYPVLDLRRHGQDLHRYLRWLEQLIIDVLADHGIESGRRPGFTGVWVDNRQPGSDRQSGPDRKIASIGVGVRHWISMHGFALNVGGDLSPFQHIVPCGIANIAMTSMEKELGRSLSLIDVAADFEKLIVRRLSDLRN
jgi:lipoyl(octanoyl) transferase